jgi:SAM-dependent methyltransferase
MSRVPRSNSFHFAPLRDVARAPGAACPLASEPERLKTAVGSMSRERLVFLRFRDRMRLFQSDTTDFTSPEIQRIRELGQLYMDVSVKHAPDDFSRDLRKLSLEAECQTCLQLSHCAGCHSAVAQDVFRRDEGHVLRRLRELEGDILDVGAGHAPYAAEVATSVHYERATYLAIDPDAERLELLRKRYPWAETHVGTIEDLANEPRRFQHVLFLRSYNHLDDPARSLRAARELLEPGGALFLADDVAFGLVRSREQVTRAESSASVGFEHYRNDSAHEAHAEVEKLGGFSVVERHDVSIAGSNLWLLRYRKND